MPRLRPLAVALPVLAFVGIGFWAWPTSPAKPASVPDAPLTAAEAAPSASPPPSAPTAAVRMQTARSAASSAVDATGLAARVDAWAHSSDPHDAMEAYQAIFRCLLARRRAHAADLEPDAPGEDAASVCGDLRSDQVQQRLALLEQAARAGERGAAENFIQEGPSGNGALSDLGTRDPTPPTPDWLARRNDYIERALARCDMGLAWYLGTFVRQRETRPAATAYWQGRLGCPNHPAANTAPLAGDQPGQAWLDALAINGWQP